MPLYLIICCAFGFALGECGISIVHSPLKFGVLFGLFIAYGAACA